MGWWFKERVGGHWEKETAVGVLVKYKTAYVKVRELTFCFSQFYRGSCLRFLWCIRNPIYYDVHQMLQDLFCLHMQDLIMDRIDH